MYTLQEITRITGSRLSGEASQQIDAFFHDSRLYHISENALFIALESERNNGHHYISDLAGRGVKAFLVKENGIDLKRFKNKKVSFIISPDPLKAIQDLAAFHRSRFSIPVIGITGSNGKTVVKEWLYQLLKSEHTICRSPKSYNSQIGVPLSVLNLREGHTLGIFEAGISKPGEMEALERIIRPAYGIFTSFGSAHDEGFTSREEKLREKLLLFKNADTVILAGLDEWQDKISGINHPVFVSTEEGSDMRIKNPGKNPVLVAGKSQIRLGIPFSDPASVLNAGTCAAMLQTLGYRAELISAKLQQLQPVALRLELRKAILGSDLINDFYNSDLDSLQIALDYLAQQGRRRRKILILSDIEQSGIPAGELYPRLAKLSDQHRLDMVIGIGKEISGFGQLFAEGSLFFADTLHFIEKFSTIRPLLQDATILLKGARSFGFEKISRLLELKSHDTVFEINLNHLSANINYYKGLTGPAVKMMCMVKATGYGSGSAGIARTLEHIGVNYLAVAYADEGVELRDSLIKLPVMVMSPEESAFEDIIAYSLEPEIYSFGILSAFVKKLDALGIVTPYPVHIKIDTGMNRLGFEEKDLAHLAEILKATPQVKVVSVFSHLAAADNTEHDTFTREQIRSFEKACALLETIPGIRFLKHICNSAAITRFPEAHFDMVRPGIGMYGIGQNPREQRQLKDVGVLKTRISQLKTIQPPQTVGYNRSGQVEKETQIAVIPLGYADGFSRLLGNRKHGVYIQGKFCRTIGNICMDMTMIDISGLNCKEGDEVIVFENAMQLKLLASAMQSIPYEVLTNISERVKRVYVQE